MTQEKNKTALSVERLDWLDATRGLAIIAVIAYHVDLGMVLSNIPTPEYLHRWLAAADLVRMPLLVFLAGLAIRISRGSDRPGFVRGRALKLAYPFLIWAVAYAAVWHLLPTERNSRELLDVLLAPIWPNSHLWFLQALLFYTLTIPVLARISVLAGLALAAAVSLSVGFSGEQLKDEASLQLFAPHRALYVWFAAGYLSSLPVRAWVASTGWQLRAGLGLAGLTAVALLGPALAHLRYLPQSAPVAALGIAAVVLTVSCIRRGWRMHAFLAVFGVYSLEIYVLHIGVLSVLRQTLNRMAALEGGPLYLSCLVLATALSLAAAVLVQKTPARLLFSNPFLAARGGPGAGGRRLIPGRSRLGLALFG